MHKIHVSTLDTFVCVETEAKVGDLFYLQVLDYGDFGVEVSSSIFSLCVMLQLILPVDRTTHS